LEANTKLHCIFRDLVKILGTGVLRWTTTESAGIFTPERNVLRNSRTIRTTCWISELGQ